MYDAISLPPTQNPAYDILAPGGQLVLVLPDLIDAAKKSAVPNKKVAYVYGNVNAPERRKAGRSLYSKLTALLEEGAIKVCVIGAGDPTWLSSIIAKPSRNSTQRTGRHPRGTGKNEERSG